MSTSLAGISAVGARIQSIESRFRPNPAPPALELQSAEPFDPFGDAYQRAIEARPTEPLRATTASVMPGLGYERARLVETTGSTSSEIAAVTSTTGSPKPGSIGGYGRMPVPDRLAAYGNGRVPAEQMTPIGQPGHRLFEPAAAAWNDLVAAAAADGFDLRITDSYRSYDNQVDLVGRKGLYSEGGLAAKPGTSNHGWGLAVDADVTDPAMLAWVREHGNEFGWVEAVPREPWHWEFRPHQT